MTVAEAEHMRRAAEKGRSASFCVPRQLHLTLSLAHSSNDVSADGASEVIAQQTFGFMEATKDKVVSQPPRVKLQTTSAARRSQSCRVQGSRPPRVQRRHESSQGSGVGLDRGSKNNSENVFENSMDKQDDVNDSSYTPYLIKVGSMSKLVTLAPVEDTDSSPTLRRSASARRPRPPSSPNNSPTPVRIGGRATGSSSMKNRSSTRRGTTSTSGSTKRVSSGFLDVRPAGSAETLDPDAYLQRNFSTTNKGIINRGDSFRRRRSRSNSIQPSSDNLPGSPHIPVTHRESTPVPPSPEHYEQQDPATATSDPERFRVVIIGNPGVGKTSLLNQFQTSECINAYDCAPGEEKNQPISIVLNSIESEISFVNTPTAKDVQNEMQRHHPAEGWVVVYSIIDKASFQKATEELTRLQTIGLLKRHAVVLVGNKCELVRSRAVPTDDAKDLACSFGCKFMEISVGMNHKCDELLVGILHQLRLKEDPVTEAAKNPEEKTPWLRNRSLMRASVKAKRLVNRIIGKPDSKHKVCEDFHI